MKWLLYPYAFAALVAQIILTEPVQAQSDPLVLGMTPCCPNTIVQYNTQTGGMEVIAEVGTGEYVVTDIIDSYDEFGNLVGQDTVWTFQGDFFTGTIGGSVFDEASGNLYLIRNFKLIRISTEDGSIAEVAPLEDVRELIAQDQNTGQIFASTICCPNNLVMIDPETGNQELIAEIGTAEKVLADIVIHYDENGMEVARDSVWDLRGDYFTTVSGPALATSNGSRIFMIRNERLIEVDALRGVVNDVASMSGRTILAYDSVGESLFLRTTCCPNKLQKYSLRDQTLSTIADIGMGSDVFTAAIGLTTYDDVGRYFYMRRNDQLTRVSMSGEIVVEMNEFFNELSILGGLRTGTRVGIEPDLLRANQVMVTASPNPFRDRLEISILPSASQNYRLEIFGTLGRRVALLHDGNLAGGAAHIFTFDAAGLASGVYLLRVQAGAFVETRRLALVK